MVTLSANISGMAAYEIAEAIIAEGCQLTSGKELSIANIFDDIISAIDEGGDFTISNEQAHNGEIEFVTIACSNNRVAYLHSWGHGDNYSAGQFINIPGVGCDKRSSIDNVPALRFDQLDQILSDPVAAIARLKSITSIWNRELPPITYETTKDAFIADFKNTARETTRS